MAETKEVVAGFQRLFIGRTDCWGSVEGKANKEPVTAEHYQRHLEKKVSLGIYPLLDDNTCWFAVIDIDVRDWQKTLAIREAFKNLDLAVYISLSKSKGYHIWLFADEQPFFASEVRQVLVGVLRKLGIEAEIFPKQDKLDQLTPLGNYINLPCYGELSSLPSRFFLSKEQKEVRLEDALKLITRIKHQEIQDAINQLPPPPPVVMVLPVAGGAKAARDKEKPRKAPHPACILTILKGVPHGARDVAAFALARHYLDQLYIPEEVLALLMEWDKKNDPPISDPKLLETKVKSAAKGYAFGCASVKGEPLLQRACIGIENCEWLARAIKERKKKGLIRELSYYENSNLIYEEIISSDKASFVAFNKKSREYNFVSEVQETEVTIQPIYTKEVTEGAVTFPTGVEEYGDTLKLINDLKNHINKYVDIEPLKGEFCAWYIIGTWVYDRLNTLAYLRFTGDTGTGKSRSLDVIGRLAYKPMMLSGAVTPAPIYRLVRNFRGTLVMEEADFRDTSEKSEVVIILNCGFERGRPVIRCSKENPDVLEVLPCYGPKIFATRFVWDDAALEARCLSFIMAETDREDIPPILGSKYYEEATHLRNKLLLWRLHHLEGVNPDSIENIDIGKIEPRLKQIGISYAVPFKDYPEVLASFKKFMKDYNQYIIGVRADTEAGKIVQSIFKLAKQYGKDMISSKLIAEDLKSDNVIIDPRPIGKHLSSFGIIRSNRRAETGRAHYIQWNNKVMRKLLRRYMGEFEKKEYEELVEEKPPRVDLNI